MRAVEYADVYFRGLRCRRYACDEVAPMILFISESGVV